MLGADGVLGADADSACSPPSSPDGPLPAGQPPEVAPCTDVFRFVKTLLMSGPIEVSAPIIVKEINAATSPYSIAV